MFKHSLRELEHPNEGRNEKKFLHNLIRFHSSIKMLGSFHTIRRSLFFSMIV